MSALTDDEIVDAQELADRLTRHPERLVKLLRAGAATAAKPEHPVTTEGMIDQRHLAPGGSFILDQPEGVPAVWGHDDQVLWSVGEALWIVGPPGVGKTTLVGQLVRGRLGLADHAVDWPIVPGERRVLYLAMDRPRQIARALRRHFGPEDRDVLDEKLIIWQGPPPGDLAKYPSLLVDLAEKADADTVVIDSVKDAAVKLSDDETGGKVNRAIQQATVEGVEVVVLHHQRKGQNGAMPNTLADVYGSTWLTAGAGSVILLWGAAGDLVVEMHHLKQPASEVGPLTLAHDHDHGTTEVVRGWDPLAWLRNRGANGGTTSDAAKAMTAKSTVNENDKRKALRRLDRLVSDGLATRTDPKIGGEGGSTGAVYVAVIGLEEMRT